MSKCKEGGEEERRAKEDRNICADLDGGLGGGDPQSAAIKDLIGFQTAFYKRKVVRMSVVEILDIKFVICRSTSLYHRKKTFLLWEKDSTGKDFDGISTMGRCDQRGSLAFYCSSWLCAEGPSRLTLL